MVFSEIKLLWRIVCRSAVLAGVLLSFFAILEVVRAFHTFYTIHPAAGYGFLVLLLGLAVWGFWYFWSAFCKYPKVLLIPSQSRPRKYGKYLGNYLERLKANDFLDEDDRQMADKGREMLRQVLANSKDSDALQEVIRQTEKDCVEPILHKLDRLADGKIRGGVRDIMLAVTLSPYRSVDLLVVLYRNLAMVGNVAAVYNSRPRLRETLAILYDTARVVATVNFVNLGAKMIDNVTKGLPGMIPGISRIVDDCTEGLAAGLLTSITGHAAQQRCRAFRGWDYEEAKKNIARHLKTFTADVGKMFFQDITPNIRLPIGLGLDKWKELKESVARGFNDTIEAIQNFVRFGKSDKGPQEEQ